MSDYKEKFEGLFPELAPETARDVLLFVEDRIFEERSRILAMVEAARKETCDCEEDPGYHSKECDFFPFGYNAALDDLTQKIRGEELDFVEPRGFEVADKNLTSGEAREYAAAPFKSEGRGLSHPNADDTLLHPEPPRPKETTTPQSREQGGEKIVCRETQACLEIAHTIRCPRFHEISPKETNHQ